MSTVKNENDQLEGLSNMAIDSYFDIDQDSSHFTELKGDMGHGIIRHLEKEFNDYKPGKILTFDRKYYIDALMNESKKSAGPAKYDTTFFDEKRVKPARGVAKQNQSKFTMTDECIERSKQTPSFYNPIHIVSIFPFCCLTFCLFRKK